MLAHVCGTCRFGKDPASSVLDAFNRAHGIDNLHAVDGSFFPSSAEPGLDHRRQCSAHCGPFAERQPTAPRDARLAMICHNLFFSVFRAYFVGVDAIPHEISPKKDLGGLPPAIYVP